MDLQRTTEIAVGIAQEAGALALAQFGHIEGCPKGDGSLVTATDRECEELIRARLRKHFPGDSIFGEEMGMEGPADHPRLWYLDPIDGTSNFIFGLPTWGVSIGLAVEGRPVAGAFFMPVTQQTWWAWQGGGAYCNGRRLAVCDRDTIVQTDLVCVSSTMPDRYHLDFPHKIRCWGSAAYALASMAGGSYVAMLHDHWHLHDVAAGVVMCAEAGAVITYGDGTPFETFTGINPKGLLPALILAGPKLHGRVLAGLKKR